MSGGKRRSGNALHRTAMLASSVAAEELSDRPAGDGDQIMVLYRGALQDGTVFDSTEGRGPIGFTLGSGQVVRGFENALRGMRPGEKKTVTLAPEEAYGEREEQLVITVPASQAPKGLEEGMSVNLGAGNRRIRATVMKVAEDGSVTLDANSPLAGKSLVFDIELVGFKEKPRRGLEMVGWRRKPLQVGIGISNSPVSQVFKNPKWPSSWPYKPSDFRRQDESSDGYFYDQPRFVAHIDEDAIGAIRDFYALQFALAPQGEFSVLDICSSWISHYPEDLRAKRVAITGMVQEELSANKQATEFAVKDLNADPTLPFDDQQFDFVTNVVSVDYLSRPREVFKEMHRVTKPGGVAIMSFSNRCFPSKAIAMWVANMEDGPGHCQIVGNYFHFNPEGGWRDISSVDISRDPDNTNPMWVVTAVRV